MSRWLIAPIAVATAAIAVTPSAADLHELRDVLREPHEVWYRPSGGLTAELTGRLYSDASHGCAWLGSPKTGDFILWPKRYRLAFRPLRVIAPGGRVVAREGDWIRSAGGVVSTSRPRSCPRADATWWPSSLEFWGRTRPTRR